MAWFCWPAKKRDALARRLPAAQEAARTLRTVYEVGGEPRVTVEQAEARARALADELDMLGVQYAADAQAQTDALALDVRQLAERRRRAETAQVVRAPVSGRVAEVRVKDATQAGVLVEVVIVSEVSPNDNS